MLSRRAKRAITYTAGQVYERASRRHGKASRISSRCSRHFQKRIRTLESVRLQLLIDDNVVDAASITPHHPGTWVALVEEDAVGISRSVVRACGRSWLPLLGRESAFNAGLALHHLVGPWRRECTPPPPISPHGKRKVTRDLHPLTSPCWKQRLVARWHYP